MTINSKLNQLIVSSKELYHRLVLVVGDKDECSEIIHEISKGYEAQPININLKLSEKLLQLNHRRRQLKVKTLVEDLMRDEKDIAFLTDTEILFDSSLQQDPLRFLQDISRNKVIVAHWGGKLSNDKLTYAVPSHSEYREYSSNKLVVINTDGETSFDIDL